MNEKTIEKLSNVCNGFVFDKEIFDNYNLIYWRRKDKVVLSKEYTVKINVYFYPFSEQLYVNFAISDEKGYHNIVNIECMLEHIESGLSFKEREDTLLSISHLDMDVIRKWCNMFTCEYVEKTVNKALNVF